MFAPGCLFTLVSRGRNRVVFGYCLMQRRPSLQMIIELDTTCSLMTMEFSELCV